MPRGGRRPGAGRKPGVPNKNTQAVRDAVEKALNNQNDKLSVWFDQVAEEDPAKALTIYGQLLEYVAAKLQRKELVGPDGAAIVFRIEDE
jgi:hypothetical protein